MMVAKFFARNLTFGVKPLTEPVAGKRGLVDIEDLQDPPRALSAYDSENLMSIDPVGLMGMGFERFFAKPTGRKTARKAEMVRVTNVMA